MKQIDRFLIISCIHGGLFYLFLYFCALGIFHSKKGKKIRWVWVERKFIMIKLEYGLLLNI